MTVSSEEVLAEVRARFTRLTPDQQAAFVASLPPDEYAALAAAIPAPPRDPGPWAWATIGREAQLPPPGWTRVWYIRAARGTGKTRAGAENLARLILTNPPGEWGVVAPTYGDARDVCLEGESGLLRALGSDAVKWNRSIGELYVEGGSVVRIDGADDGALRIQGHNLRGCWGDEIGLWRAGWKRAWEESIRYAVRIDPAVIILTGTPKAGHPLVTALVSDPSVVQTHMRTRDNIANLSAATVAELEDRYGGTRLGRQELEGEVLEDVEGALWNAALIDLHRLDPAVVTRPNLRRVVVAVDPPGGATECGIVVAGLADACPCQSEARLPHMLVLDDVSKQAPPDVWASLVVSAFRRHEADRVVAERNYGGDMVEAVIAAADRGVPVKVVTATRGKVVRAEPVVTLYEKGRVHHWGTLAGLESEMTTWVPPGHDESSGWSPNRLDACLVAGTAVLTDRGERPIEAVPTGARVWTRAGWRPVVAAGMTDPDGPTVTVELSNGRTLRGTGEHPVWTAARGWVRLDALVCGDRLSGWRARSSSTGESATPATPTATDGPTASTTSPTVAADGGFSTATSTPTRTGRSRRAGTSTTATATRSTTTRPTSRPSPRPTTPASTPASTTTTRRGSLISSPSGLWLPSGTAPPKDAPGTVSTDARAGRTGSRTSSPASSAASRANGSGPTPPTAHGGAGSAWSTANTATTTGFPAPSAGPSSGRAATAPFPSPVDVRVVRVTATPAAPVWNLEVAGQPEYVASGVIVHNCVWAAWDLLVGESGPASVASAAGMQLPRPRLTRVGRIR